MSSSDSPEAPPQSLRRARLPTRQVVLVGENGVEAIRSTVHCPVKRNGQAVPTCLGCARLESACTDALVCVVPETATERGVAGELVPRETLVLDAELPVDEALVLLRSSQLLSAPVVDDNAALLGMVMRSELAALCDTPGAAVEDGLIPVVAVNEHLSVLQLAEVMDAREVDRVPVVDEHGHLLGVVTSLDVLRWLRKKVAGTV